MMTPHDEPLLTPHAHFGLVVAMGQGNSQGELAGDPRGIARFYPGLEMAMWHGGFAGGFAGDSRGIRSPFGGFALNRGVFPPRFGGIRVRPRQAFIILKGGWR